MAIVLVAAVAASISPALQANLIVNGDFETGTFAGWTATGTGTALLNASDIDYQTFASAIGTFPTGTRVAAFGGGNVPADGVLSQSVATAAGQQYLLSFDYGNYDLICCRAQAIGIAVLDVATGTTLASLDLVDTSGTRVLDVVLSPYTLAFAAVGASTRVVFTDTSIDSFAMDGLLDNVSIVSTGAVPEPATFWLALIGLATMTWTARQVRLQTRRRNTGTQSRFALQAIPGA